MNRGARLGLPIGSGARQCGSHGETALCWSVGGAPAPRPRRSRDQRRRWLPLGKRKGYR
jgi:hypothetical protein